MSDGQQLPVPLSIMARRLRVRVRWLREEAEAGREPALKAETQWLFDPKAVEAVLLLRARASDDGEEH